MSLMIRFNSSISNRAFAGYAFSSMVTIFPW